MRINQFSHIELDNGIVVSVQAGRCLYCNPRINLDSLIQYDSVEVCIFSNPKIDFDKFQTIYEYATIEEPMGYVPIDELLTILKYLESL
jgi:hypothetical protein